MDNRLAINIGCGTVRPGSKIITVYLVQGVKLIFKGGHTKIHIVSRINTSASGGKFSFIVNCQSFDWPYGLESIRSEYLTKKSAQGSSRSGSHLKMSYMSVFMSDYHFKPAYKFHIKRFGGGSGQGEANHTMGERGGKTQSIIRKIFYDYGYLLQVMMLRRAKLGINLVVGFLSNISHHLS